MPKISVVIPVCNVQQYLKQCVSSVLNQTLLDIEIICVDDGSKDNSLSILREFEQKDERVKVITKPNSGYGNSMNRGIAAATGTYIGIVESDDFIAPHMYETMWKLSDNGKVDVIKGNFWDYYDWDNQEPEAVINTERRNMPDVEESFNIRQYPQILWGHPSIWSGIYRREFLLEHGIHFIEAKGGGWVDNPFFFDTLCNAKRIKWTKEPFYYYRKTNMNSSSNNQTDLTIPLKRMMDNLDVLDRNHYNDEVTLGYAYARGLMYLRGLMPEKHYMKQYDIIRPYAQQLMCKMNVDVICKNFHLRDQTLFNRFRSPLKILMSPSGKLLIYNWVPFDNPKRVGGGVTIYCYNLIKTILRERPDIQVYFLSSGWAYDLSTTECYVRSTQNIFGDRCRSFEIVNSPVPAAQNMLLNRPNLAFENEKLKHVFRDFLMDYGPFHAVHFNNIEGLSLDTLDLKNDLPETKFIFSIHNYVPFCITGFYFDRHNKCNCSPSHTPDDCLNCTNIGRRDNISNELLARAVRATPTEKQMNHRQWLKEFQFDQLDSVGDAKSLYTFTQRARSVLNKNMDHMLAVSQRVMDIAVNNGMDAQKTMVSYIGTLIAEQQIGSSVADPNSQFFKIGFLGSDYKFIEKGYPFLMKALSSLDVEEAGKIDLMLTTYNGNEQEMREQLSNFHSVQIVKGYNHDDLRKLLHDVHLGVVPVLWEDNLPQIAIEMAAMGVPVLASDCGGASELCSSELFRFHGGDLEDFKKHLLNLVHNPELLEVYWKKHTGLTTMHQHWTQLEELYHIPRIETVSMTLEQYSLLLEENDFLYNNLGGAKLEFYRNELYAVRSSWTYKIGRFVTFIPRKIRGLVRCYRENGMKYTIRRSMEHLSGRT